MTRAREQVRDCAGAVSHCFGLPNHEALKDDLFSNRGELLMALLEREEARALALLAEVMPSAPSVDPDALIVEGFRAFLESVAANPTTWRLKLLS